jgi:hypothetical protein
MDNTSLEKKLRQYIGRRVRISSHVRGNRPSVVLDAGRYPELMGVRQDETQVWIHTDDGVWQVVVQEGLTIEPEPIVGTHDMMEMQDIGEAVATVIRRYGPTGREKRGWCSCPVCVERREQEERDVDSGPVFHDEPKVEPVPDKSSEPDDGLDLSKM